VKNLLVSSNLSKLIAIFLFLGIFGPAVMTGFAQAPAKNNVKAYQAQLTICKEVDDNWNPVGASETWPANQTFNVLLIAQTPFKVDFVGFIIYKQGSDGKDVEFINEWQQTIENSDQTRKYCTTEGLTSLPQGKYSIYAINWRKREVTEHLGNLTDYFAKVNLTVK
jgi:hypothetical protein